MNNLLDIEMGRERNYVSSDNKIIKPTPKVDNIYARINRARMLLEPYDNMFTLLNTNEELESYVALCEKNGVVSIDTETTGLDPLQDKLVGVSLYTPGNIEPCYIALNHINNNSIIDYPTMSKCLHRLSKLNVIMFNAKFDLRVLKNYCGFKCNVYWDGYIAARLLNTNEPVNSLKGLWDLYCGDNNRSLRFDDLFNGVSFDIIPVDIAYKYAAKDALITYQLYQYQKQVFKDPDLERMYDLFVFVELPLINVLCEMENNGFGIDLAFSQQLSITYNEKLKEVQAQFYEECLKHQDKISKYFALYGNKAKIRLPLNISSPEQMGVLIYDILGLKHKLMSNKVKEKSTALKVLKTMDHPIIDIILEYRGLAKLLSTYIDNIPYMINPNTKKIHCNFNQIGADTGRMSANNPNITNIPSKNKEIRKMFVPSAGNFLISMDFSSQEPRLLAHMTKDARMIQAFADGKDLYVEIASIVYNLPYEDCCEFKDGVYNSEGKKRRSECKNILLGICYGKGVKSIAQDLGIKTEKAQQVYDKVLEEFSGLRQFMIDSENQAKTLGYVETFFGRRRQIPEISLSPFTFSYSKLIKPADKEMYKAHFLSLLVENTWYEDRDKIIEEAKRVGVYIQSNSGIIAAAHRQCVNSRIQGGAADMTKIALVNIYGCEELKALGFKLLASVHDEVIGECPEENIERVLELFEREMLSAFDYLDVVGKVDNEVTRRWYGESAIAA